VSDKLPPKAQLLKEWHERKGNEPWTLEEIAELIADASWLGEQAAEERIREVLQAEADHSSTEEYQRAFTQFLADLPYTAEELFGEWENK
jgi:hypothetical protein